MPTQCLMMKVEIWRLIIKIQVTFQKILTSSRNDLKISVRSQSFGKHMILQKKNRYMLKNLSEKRMVHYDEQLNPDVYN